MLKLLQNRIYDPLKISSSKWRPGEGRLEFPSEINW